MSRPPKVSVIIPTYNRATLVCEAIKSVLTQTFGDYEVWVVDDGSTDETREAVRPFLGPRLHYVYQDNCGLSKARNTGIEKSLGDYVALLDSDDRCLPDRLLEQSRLLDNDQDVDVVFSDLWKVYPNGSRERFAEKVPVLERVLACCQDEGNCIIPANSMLPLILVDLPFKPSTLMFRRRSLQRVGLFDDRLLKGELDLMIRLIQSGAGFAYIHKPLVDLRVWEGNIHVRHPRERYETTIGILTRLRQSGALNRREDKLARRGIAMRYFRLGVHYEENGLRAKGRSCFLKAFRYSPNPWFLGHVVSTLVPRGLRPTTAALRKSWIGTAVSRSLNPHRIGNRMSVHRSGEGRRLGRVLDR